MTKDEFIAGVPFQYNSPFDQQLYKFHTVTGIEVGWIWRGEAAPINRWIYAADVEQVAEKWVRVYTHFFGKRVNRIIHFHDLIARPPVGK